MPPSAWVSLLPWGHDSGQTCCVFRGEALMSGRTICVERCRIERDAKSRNNRHCQHAVTIDGKRLFCEVPAQR